MSVPQQKIFDCNTCHRVFSQANQSEFINYCNSCSYYSMLDTYQVSRKYTKDEGEIIKKKCNQINNKRYDVCDINNELYNYYKTIDDNSIPKRNFMKKYNELYTKNKKYISYGKTKKQISNITDALLLKMSNSNNNVKVYDHIDYVRTLENMINISNKVFVLAVAMKLFNFIVDNHEKLQYYTDLKTKLYIKIINLDFGNNGDNVYYQGTMLNSLIYRSLTPSTMRYSINNIDSVCNQYYTEIYDRYVLPVKRTRDAQKKKEIELKEAIKKLLPKVKDQAAAVNMEAYYGYLNDYQTYRRYTVDEIANMVAQKIKGVREQRKIDGYIDRHIIKNIDKKYHYNVPYNLRRQTGKTKEEAVKAIDIWYEQKYGSQNIDNMLEKKKIYKNNTHYSKIYKLLVSKKIKEGDIDNTLNKLKRKDTIDLYIKTTYSKSEQNIAKLDSNYKKYIDTDIELDIFKITVENVLNNLNYETKCKKCVKPVIVANIIYTESNKGPYCIGCFGKL